MKDITEKHYIRYLPSGRLDDSGYDTRNEALDEGRKNLINGIICHGNWHNYHEESVSGFIIETVFELSNKLT